MDWRWICALSTVGFVFLVHRPLLTLTLIVLILFWLTCPDTASKFFAELNELSLLILINFNLIPQEEEDKEPTTTRLHRLSSISEEPEPNENEANFLLSPHSTRTTTTTLLVNDLSRSHDNNFFDALFLDIPEKQCLIGSGGLSPNKSHSSPKLSPSQRGRSPIITTPKNCNRDKSSSRGLSPGKANIDTSRVSSYSPVILPPEDTGPGSLDFFYAFDDFEERVHTKLLLTNQVARKAAIFERLNSR